MGTGLAPSRYPSEPLAPLAPHQKRQTSCKAPLSAPPLAAPLPERNPEVLTAALSCWNWLIAATHRDSNSAGSHPPIQPNGSTTLNPIIPMEEDTGRVWQSDAVRQGSLETPCRQ
jgi:hypothetical protein